MDRTEIALELVKLIVNENEKTSLTNEKDTEEKSKNIAKAYDTIFKSIKDTIVAKQPKN